MIIIKTPRLNLRTWDLGDLESGLKIWGDREVSEYLGFSEPLTREEVLDSIKRGIDHQMKYGYQHWAVVLKDTDELIGACGFNYFNNAIPHGNSRDSTVELVFHFKKRAWGNGYASEAAFACVEYAKKYIKADRIVAAVHEARIPSVRILQKLGFEYLGLVYFDDRKTFEPMYSLNLKIIRSEEKIIRP